MEKLIPPQAKQEIVIPAVPKFSYVTAELVTPIVREGEEPDAVRQGVYVANKGDGTIIVAGETDIYHCKADANVVPDQNLFGSTKEFVETIRKANQ